MKLPIITIVALLSLISAFVVHADGRTLEEVLAENESLRYQIALVEKEIDKGPPAASIQLPPGMIAVD